MKVGILAYGSLIFDPGKEIIEATVEVKCDVVTPFNVEFARSSKTRGGAPTLVPVEEGQPVAAKLFLLNVDECEAANRLYRREINKVGSGKCYEQNDNPREDKIVVERLEKFKGVDVVL